MIKADRTWIHVQLLDLLVKYLFKKRFSKVNIFYEEAADFPNSILMIGNHVTWWDGFVSWKLNKILFKKNFYLMMLEERLSKLLFFKKVGAFSVNPGNRSVIESLKYATDLLANQANYLQIYPQGKLQSFYDEKFEFNKGLEYILKKSPNTSLYFYATFVDYSSYEKPYMNIFVKRYSFKSSIETEVIQNAYSEFYALSKEKHTKNFIA